MADPRAALLLTALAPNTGDLSRRTMITVTEILIHAPDPPRGRKLDNSL
jgi:hypothetical protein